MVVLGVSFEVGRDNTLGDSRERRAAVCNVLRPLAVKTGFWRVRKAADREGTRDSMLIYRPGSRRVKEDQLEAGYSRGGIGRTRYREWRRRGRREQR